jgi:hypothetical protein
VYYSDCVDETFEQARQSNIVWSAFYDIKKFDIVFISGKAKLDSATYVETVIVSHLMPF